MRARVIKRRRYGGPSSRQRRAAAIMRRKLNGPPPRVRAAHPANRVGANRYQDRSGAFDRAPSVPAFYAQARRRKVVGWDTRSGAWATRGGVFKAGLLRAGKPPLARRIGFLLRAFNDDRASNVGRYLTSRVRGGRLPPRRGRRPIQRVGRYDNAYTRRPVSKALRAVNMLGETVRVKRQKGHWVLAGKLPPRGDFWVQRMANKPARGPGRDRVRVHRRRKDKDKDWFTGSLHKSAVRFTVAKNADVTGRYIAGWFSVVTKGGELVEDIQGDVILMDDLREAAHEFVKTSRVAKAMHDGDPIGDVIESVIIDDDFAKAHGIEHDERGWWGAIEVTDPTIRKRIRKGELRCFSIGGGGQREPFHKRRAPVRLTEAARRFGR